MSTQQLPEASTTISLNGCPASAVRRQVRPGDHTGSGGDHEASVGEPVDRERQPLDARHHLARRRRRRRRAPRPPPSRTSRTGRRATGAIRPSGSRWRRSPSWTVRLPRDDGTHRVRPARAADLDAPRSRSRTPAGRCSRSTSATPIEPILLSPAMDGRQRGDEPGFLLVAATGESRWASCTSTSSTGTPTSSSSRCCPSTRRRGIGSALVRAAMDEARALGFDRLSLCTYRDVPWNGPFYRRARLRRGEPTSRRTSCGCARRSASSVWT